MRSIPLAASFSVSVFSFTPASTMRKRGRKSIQICLCFGFPHSPSLRVCALKKDGSAAASAPGRMDFLSPRNTIVEILGFIAKETRIASLSAFPYHHTYSTGKAMVLSFSHKGLSYMQSTTPSPRFLPLILSITSKVFVMVSFGLADILISMG